MYEILEWAIFLGLAFSSLCLMGIDLLAGYALLKKYTPPPPLRRYPPVSVIVAARNEKENLKALIPQLVEQQYGTFEVIIIDDRSDDITYDYLLAQQQAFENLRLIRVNNLPEHMNGKKYALTLGIKAANYEHLLFTDADCRPDSRDWIKFMMRGYRSETEIVLGYSGYQDQPGLLNRFIRFETLRTGIHYLAAAIWGIPYMGVGRNLSYKKSLFLEKKGFEGYQALTGGDDDLFVNRHARARNVAVVIEQEAHTTSRPKTDLKSYSRQKLRHLSVGRYYRLKHQFLLGSWSLFHGIFWLFLCLLPFSPRYWIIGLLLAVSRMILFIFLFHRIGSLLGTRIPLVLLPLLDFLYLGYYIIIGRKAYYTKLVRWN